MPAEMILALWLCQIGDSSCRLVPDRHLCIKFGNDVAIWSAVCLSEVIDHSWLSTSRILRHALVVLIAFTAHAMRLTRVVRSSSCIMHREASVGIVRQASCVKHRASIIRVVALRQCVLFPVCICYKNTCGASSCECNNENTFNTRVLTIVAFSITWEGWWIEVFVAFSIRWDGCWIEVTVDWSYGGWNEVRVINLLVAPSALARRAVITVHYQAKGKLRLVRNRCCVSGNWNIIIDIRYTRSGGGASSWWCGIASGDAFPFRGKL